MADSFLNQNELEVLRVLWSRGHALKPAEIQAEFSWPIENATLRSVLLNLVGKEHVAREQTGKAFYYAVRVPKATMLQSVLRPLARVFSGGSTRELVAQLVETGDIEPEDIKLLQQVAAGRKDKKGKRNPA